MNLHNIRPKEISIQEKAIAALNHVFPNAYRCEPRGDQIHWINLNPNAGSGSAAEGDLDLIYWSQEYDRIHYIRRNW